MRSYIIKGFLGAILLWFLFLGLRYVFPIQNTNSLGSGPNQGNSLMDAASIEAARQLSSSIKDGCEGVRKTLPGTGDPTCAFEKMRHLLERDLKEMWYNVREHESNIGKESFEQIQDIYRLLRSHLLKLRQEDGYEAYREREMAELSRIMQKRIHDLQNPPDCATARKAVCSVNTGCGFGCQIHHVLHCIVIAYATSRTLILDIAWPYKWQSWEEIFMPASDSCVIKNGSTTADWGSGNDDDVQVLVLPTIRTIKSRPPYLPLAIPSDIGARLAKVHGEPHIWWVGQFIVYLMRLQPKTQALLDEAKSRMNISSTTVGVQVRRTDKVGTEAAFHPLKEYMGHVEEYFAIREKFEGPGKRRVFIASDDPNVIDEALRTYTGSEWEIIGDKTVAQAASVTERDSALIGIIKDVFLLSECDYVVCTLSSNVCRLAYEIMQTKHADASGRIVSLDEIYTYVGGSRTIQTAQFVHKPRNWQELELAVGDNIEEIENHWNGMSKGTNLRTYKVGLYPSYKARTSFAKVNFPQEKWWKESGEV